MVVAYHEVPREVGHGRSVGCDDTVRVFGRRELGEPIVAVEWTMVPSFTDGVEPEIVRHEMAAAELVVEIHQRAVDSSGASAEWGGEQSNEARTVRS